MLHGGYGGIRIFGTVPERPEDLKVLLIRRKNHPSIGDWALPGGFIDLYEDLEESAKRELFEETHIKGVETEQIRAFGMSKEIRERE